MHVNLTRIMLKDPGAQDGTSSRKERVLHSYAYPLVMSDFRSIADGMYLMQAHAHCIDPIDAVTCSTFDNNRTSLRKAPGSQLHLFECLSFSASEACEGRTTAQEPSKVKNT